MLTSFTCTYLHAALLEPNGTANLKSGNRALAEMEKEMRNSNDGQPKSHAIGFNSNILLIGYFRSIPTNAFPLHRVLWRYRQFVLKAIEVLQMVSNHYLIFR
jgi:hypothetical protein